MDLVRELAKMLRTNELDRLRCDRMCPIASSCLGLEAISLRKLSLMSNDELGVSVTSLGRLVLDESDKYSMKSPPILRD